MNLQTKAVKGIIFNEKKEILLLQRNPKLRNESNWDLPGGLIEHDETEEETLSREIKEELNITAKIIFKGKKWNFKRNSDNKIVTVQNYICEIVNGSIKLSEEHIKFEWVSIKNMENYSVKDNSFYDSLV